MRDRTDTVLQRMTAEEVTTPGLEPAPARTDAGDGAPGQSPRRGGNEGDNTDRASEGAAGIAAGTAAEAAENRFSGNIALVERAQNGDDAAMEKLIVDNTGLLRTVALRFRDRGTEFEDLMQIGTIGMIKAIRSFDTGRGTAFSTYAVPLIVGEIRRHLRDDGLIRVSRGCRRLGVQLMRERSRILEAEGREAGITELAAACGVSTEEASLALDSLAPVTSLSDSAWGEDSPELGAVIPDRAAEDELERETDRIALNQVIATLPPLWRQIVILRYYKDMTQQQVADRLGLSQVKVSREEKKIMAFMRAQLEG